MIGMGDAELASVMSRILLLGFDLDHDWKQVETWCKTGAASGDQGAVLAYAKFLSLGFFGEVDKAGAISVLETYGGASYQPAAYFRACLYFGLGGLDNADKSSIQMQALAADGYPSAVNTFAFSMMDSEDEIIDAEALLNRAAELDAPDALYWKAMKPIESGTDSFVSEGISLLKRAAEKNYAAACAALSGIYRFGKYGVEVNLEAATFYEDVNHRLSFSPED